MPARRDVALTALNVLLGLGTALSPLLIALFTDVGQWWYLPLLAAALLVFPAAGSAAAGIGVFAFGGLACSGFFPMTIGYGEATFPGIVELAAGWLIAAYQVGYGLAAFGAGALQRVVSLSAVFRIAAGAAVAMGVLALVIASRQHPTPSSTPSTSTT
jgi:hypothetical protein